MTKVPEISFRKKPSFTAAKSAAQIDINRIRSNLPKPPDVTAALSKVIDRHIALRKKVESDLEAAKEEIRQLTFLLASAQGSKSIGKSGKLRDEEIIESTILKRKQTEINHLKEDNERYKLKIQTQKDSADAGIKNIAELLKKILSESDLLKPRGEFYIRKIKALDKGGYSALQDLLVHMNFSSAGS